MEQISLIQEDDTSNKISELDKAYKRVWALKKKLDEEEDKLIQLEREQMDPHEIEIERIEAFEEKIGVRLENLNIEQEGRSFTNRLKIFGEVLEIDEKAENQSFAINAVAYDANNKVINVDNCYISDYHGYIAFDISLDFDSPEVKSRVKRIRVYLTWS